MWLSSFAWERRCLFATHLGSAQFSRRRCRQDAPNFRTALVAQSWLLGYKLCILGNNPSTQ